MYGFGTISNTIINADGHSLTFRSNSLSRFGHYNSCGSLSSSCFGYGYNPMCGNPFLFSAGAGLGYAAGSALMGCMPSILQGARNAGSWGWNKVIVPASNIIWGGIQAIGKGIGNTWNQIWGKS